MNHFTLAHTRIHTHHNQPISLTFAQINCFEKLRKEPRMIPRTIIFMLIALYNCVQAINSLDAQCFMAKINEYDYSWRSVRMKWRHWHVKAITLSCLVLMQPSYNMLFLCYAMLFCSQCCCGFALLSFTVFFSLELALSSHKDHQVSFQQSVRVESSQRKHRKTKTSSLNQHSNLTSALHSFEWT